MQYNQYLPSTNENATRVGGSQQNRPSFSDNYKDINKVNFLAGNVIPTGVLEALSGLNSMDDLDRANLFDPLGLAGNKDYQKTSSKINEMGNNALELGQNWKNELGKNYKPWMAGGLNSLFNGMNTAGDYLNQKLPDQIDSSKNIAGYQNKLSDFMKNQNIPEYMDVNKPTGPDYGAARESNLYKQMQNQFTGQSNNNTALSGGSVRGGNNKLDIARGARQNLMNAADTMYKQDINAYNSAQQNNQLRNNMLGTQYQNQTGLQNMFNQIGQNDYKTNMERYQSGQDNLMNYIGQMNKYANMGNSSLSQYSGYGSKAVGSQLDTLSGLASASASANAAKQQGLSNAIGTGAGIIGAIFSDPKLKKNMIKTGHKSKNGFDLYAWQWKDKALEVGKKLGLYLTGFAVGVNADEVKQTRPDLIHYIDGYKAVDYRGI